MPTTDSATDIALPNPPSENSQDGSEQPGSQEASGLLRGLFFGFAATMTVGLALASWYVGVRIVAADEVVPSNTTTSRPRSAAPVPPAVLYLQVAGLGPKQDADFARSLQSKGFRAQVQALDDNARILIGPFSTHAEMEEAQRTLQSAGILATETAH